MGHVRLDDYLLDGPAPPRCLNDVTGSEKVNMRRLCWAAAHGHDVGLLAAKGDTHQLGNAAQPLVNSPSRHPRHVLRSGISRSHRSQDGQARLPRLQRDVRTFDFLRANDLIGATWPRAGSWVRDPPASTSRLERRRHPDAGGDAHLSTSGPDYIENQLARGVMTLADTTLDLGQIKSTTYVLSAKEDHNRPRMSAYKTTQSAGNVRSRSRRQATSPGSSNPPSTKAVHWTNSNTPPDAKAWWPGPPSTRVRGGRTGRRGSASGPVTSARRRHWAARLCPRRDAHGEYVLARCLTYQATG